MRIDTDRLGDEIAELAAHLDAATHRLLTLSVASTMPAAGRIRARSRARTGSGGASGSSSAPPASTCAWRGPSPTYRSSTTRSAKGR
jgi:hypothetical protein